MSESTAVQKTDCETCGGKRCKTIYSDGHTFCFKCSERVPGDGSEAPAPMKKEPSNCTPLAALDFSPLTVRKISAETCKKWRYGISGDKQVANYFSDDGTTLIAQKFRNPDKTFFWKGDGNAVGLYGKWLWPKGGKRVIVTEGEIDALTVSQLQENKWPVVSVPHGANTLPKAILKDLDWLMSFETVVLALDMDKEGQEATRKCAEALPLGKVRIAKLPLKDASECMKAGKVQELMSALWNAEPFKIDGIVSAAEVAPTILEKPVMGAPWFDPRLTKLTYGRRDGELYGFGGATGGGKTDLFTEQVAFDVATLKEPTGILFLEQMPPETMRRIMGKLLSKRLHIPDGGWTDDDLKKASEAAKDLPLFLFNHFGQIDWPTVKARITYMVKALGCRSIYLDHLTALVAGSEDETKDLNRIMSELAGMGSEMGHRLHYISHLATPEGKPHEEGGRVMLRHFRGSRAIGFWTHFAFGLERDQQAENKDARLTTTLRCIKDRNTGNATGEVLFFKYDQATGKQVPSDTPPPPSTEGFRDYSQSSPPNSY